MADRVDSSRPYDVVIAAPNSALDSYYPMPAFTIGEVNRATAAYHTAGGKGFNMARAVVTLGGRPLCVGILAGSTGQFIASELEREGIPAEIIWGERETRHTATIPVASLRQSTGVIEPGVPAGAAAREAFTETVLARAPDAPFVTLTGSLPPDFAVSYYAELIARLKNRGVRVALDASGDVLRQGALAGPAILKVNVDELYSAFPATNRNGDGLIDHAASVLALLRPQGLELLLLTDGAQGAYLFAPDREPLHVQTPIESWACSAGAGDTFMAGFLLALNRRGTLEDALVQASAAAAASVHHIVGGYVDPALFERLKSQTRIRQLAPGGMQ